MDGSLRASAWVLLALCGAACSNADSGESSRPEPRFTLLPPSYTGVTFANVLPENPSRNGFTYQYYYNGGGVAVGDLNGDSLPDLYFSSNMGPNRLYLNLGGMRFQDVTERAGVAGLRGGWATGVALVDVNGDGRLDIHVCGSGPFGDPDLRRNALFVNQGVREGVLTFVDQAAAYGLDDPAYSTQAAFFDYDGDGDLDMYLMNHGIPAYRSLPQLAGGRSPSEVDKLYRNDGNRFVDVSVEAGLVDTNLGFGLGVSVGDLNNDGLPDVYVANDYSGRDYLYLGRPDGRFIEVLGQSMGHTPLASMGSDFADFDGDGWLDAVVLEMAMESHYDRRTGESGTEEGRFVQLAEAGQHYQYMSNALLWNRGLVDGLVPAFSEIANLAGVARTDWSWAGLFADLDNDGRPDLFASTGMAGASINPDFDEYMGRRVAEVEAAEGHITASLIEELLGKLPRRKVPNHVFRNEGDLSFSDRTAEWRLDQPAYSNGAAYGDLDRDGDLDLVVNNLMGEAFVYRNNSRETEGGHFLAVRLHGPPGNPFGIGARVRLMAGGRQQLQELQLTRGYESSVEPVLHFGLGENATADTLEVVWPDGSHEVRTAVAGDRYLTLDHKAAGPRGAEATPPSRRIFADAGGSLHPVPRHRSSVPVADSTAPPYPARRDDLALAVGDLNGDGLDDFVFGGSGDEPSRIYLQRDDGTFEGAAAWQSSGPGDLTESVAIFDANGDGLSDIWRVTTGRDAGSDRVRRHQLYLGTRGARLRRAPDAVPQALDAGATLAPGDFDGDGDLDLFVGAHAAPGASDAGSHLLRNDGGTFHDATDEVAPELAGLRTVTAATWADVSGDGAADLLVAGEWMPVRVFLNGRGRLEDATEAAGLAGLEGWWQSVAAADFDGDGDLDVVAGNLGLDFPYHPSADAPFELYVADFDQDGDIEAVPAYYQEGRLYPWFSRGRLASFLPSVLERYSTLDAYARATLPEILGQESMRQALHFQVRLLETSYLENAGGGTFRRRPLPRTAQISPVTDMVPADFDGDGKTDLVLAGNLEGMDASIPRQDAGVGLFLRGDGAGHFHVTSPGESGLLLGGSVRRLALLRVGPGGTPGLLAGVAGGEARFLEAAADGAIP